MAGQLNIIFFLLGVLLFFSEFTRKVREKNRES